MSIAALPRHLVAVLVLIEQAGAILLVQSKFAEEPWGLPGGLLEVGESVAQAAAREVLEETGLVIQPGRPIGFYSVPSEQALSITLTAELLGGALVQTTTETQAAAYFAFDQLPVLMRPYHRERVRDFATHPAAPIYRVQ